MKNITIFNRKAMIYVYKKYNNNNASIKFTKQKKQIKILSKLYPAFVSLTPQTVVCAVVLSCSCWTALWSRCWWCCPGSYWRPATGPFTSWRLVCVWSGWEPWLGRIWSRAETKDPVRSVFLNVSSSSVRFLMPFVHEASILLLKILHSSV